MRAGSVGVATKQVHDPPRNTTVAHISTSRTTIMKYRDDTPRGNPDEKQHPGGVPGEIQPLVAAVKTDTNEK